MQEAPVNKVSQSGLITIDLDTYYPKQEIAVFDLKDHLFMGLILKEKDFREALKKLDISIYKDKITAITCSVDAIIPMWAYMLVASSLQPVSSEVILGNKETAIRMVLLQNISKLKAEDFADKRIVIKGCGDLQIDAEAYVAITTKLRPVAKSIMYGEPCSTVPVYKKNTTA
jgi:hypothetical protein